MINLTHEERYELIDKLIDDMKTWDVNELLVWAKPAYENFLEDFDDDELVELASNVQDDELIEE